MVLKRRTHFKLTEYTQKYLNSLTKTISRQDPTTITQVTSKPVVIAPIFNEEAVNHRLTRCSDSIHDTQTETLDEEE